MTAAPAEFQFHKGAIRTLGSGHVDRLAVSFQFHKGAIRTLPPLPEGRGR